MRPGPPRGATSTLEVTVDADMAPHAVATSPHGVYGMVALVRHIEQVCRELLEPHLESGEDGVGVAVEVSQREPVPVGETVTLTATVASVQPSRLVCEVQVRHGGLNVARGSFEQRIVADGELGDEIGTPHTVAD